MNDIGATSQRSYGSTRAAGASPDWRTDKFLKVVIVTTASLLVFAAAISRSFYDGRLSAPITHNDVNYFLEGIWHLRLLRDNGFFALLADFLHSNAHAPVARYQAMFAFMLFGITDWAPYATNIIYLGIFLGFAAYLLRNSPPVVVAAAMACLIGMPLTSVTVTEFAPEIVLSLFTVVGAVLLVRLPLFGGSFRSRFIAGLSIGIGLFVLPAGFEFTFVIVGVIVGLVFLRDVNFRDRHRVSVGLVNSLANVALCLWLPIFYMAWRFDEYWRYIYDSTFDPKQNFIWLSHVGLAQRFAFYVSGDGGQFMFGDHGWAYALVIAAGLLAAWLRRDRTYTVRQAELLVLAFFFWLLPSLAPAEGEIFGEPFGYFIAFITAISLGSIYDTVRGRAGAIVVSILGFLLLVINGPTRVRVPNLPETTLTREFALDAIGRFKADLLGDATDYRDTRVYMTNIGTYAQNILLYYLVKTNPALFDWALDSQWMISNPREQLDYIHASRWDFVIAGRQGNGLTYSPYAWPAENAVYDAMRADPAYMAIDRFYGPKGREIVVFQRRGNFAGWREISGLVALPGKPDAPRSIAKDLAYLQAFAARPVQTDLEIQWAGATAGQKLRVLVNDKEVSELSFDPGTKSSSLKTEVALLRGKNDIVLQSDHPVSLQRLIIAPRIELAPKN